MRRITRVGQKLSGHLKSVRDDTTTAINKRFEYSGSLSDCQPRFFINMDQTAVFFEAKSSTTVDKKGKSTVSAKDSGSNSKQCTVVVCVAADGTKLPLFFIFKATPGKRVEKELEEQGILGCVQKKGWFDSRVAKIWFNKVMVPYMADCRGSSLLLIDQFSVHLTSEFTNLAYELGMDVDYIPAGYTCVLQPVDVGVNAPFKAKIRQYHHEWCIEHYRGMCDDDRVPVPNRNDIVKWCTDSFSNIDPESIKKVFLSIGFILN